MAMQEQLLKDGGPIPIGQYPQVLQTKYTFWLSTTVALDIPRVALRKRV